MTDRRTGPPPLRSKLVAYGVVAAVVGATLTAALALALSRSGLPQRSGTASVAGLGAAVEIAFDEWGVPHVTAESWPDLARAVGYLHANDRLLQLELGRRLASGRLAEVVGDIALPSDRYYVGLGMRRHAQGNLAALSPESRTILEAYAAGVNAWLEEREGDLPPELLLLRVRPEPWTPLDSMYLQLQLTHDLSFFQGRPEENRLAELRDLGAARFRDLTGMSEAEVPDDLLADVGSLSSSTHLASVPPRTPWLPHLQSPGSNNWAIGGSHTASGNAIVANDPHLPLRLPSIWYQVSLHSPEYAVAGMTIPGFPFVILGQSEDLAWAFTNVMLDDHDVFLEDVSPDGTRVRRGDEWLRIEIVREEIRRAHGAPETLSVGFTDIGVVLEADPERELPARSLAWTGAVPADLTSVALTLGAARSVHDIVGNLEGWMAPAQNVVAADRDGNLLFTAIGRVPRRGSSLGRLPAPAWNLANAWQGLYPQRTNRTVVNPGNDQIVTANTAIEGAVGPERAPLPQADFDTQHRARRIVDILESRGDWTVDAMASAHIDVRSLYAEEVIGLLGDGPFDGSARRAYQLLEDWNFEMRGAGAAALFEIFEQRLSAAIFDESAEHRVGRIDRRKRLLRVLHGVAAADWFDDQSTAVVETRDQIVAAALADSWTAAIERWGDEPASWSYGDLHRLHLENPLGAIPLIGGRFNRGPFAWSGSETTVAAYGRRDQGASDLILYGPSMRWISDPADPDRSLAVLPGGQSGHPFDAHYADQIELYETGQLRSVVWSAEKARAAAASTLRLEPASSR